jgi:hypothetical protein
MTKPEMVAFIDRYLTYNPSCDLTQIADTFPNPPTEFEWVSLIENLVLSRHLKTHGNGNHVLTSPIKPKSHKQELLMYLYNSDKHKTDIKPLIKSINISKDELCLLLQTMYAKKEINSDNLWRPYKMAGSDKTIEDFEFNFWLTNEGEQLVTNKYLYKPTMQHFGDVVSGDKVMGNKHIGDNIQGSNFRDFKPTINPPIADTVHPKSTENKNLLSKFLGWILQHLQALLLMVAAGLIVAFISFMCGWVG